MPGCTVNGPQPFSIATWKRLCNKLAGIPDLAISEHGSLVPAADAVFISNTEDVGIAHTTDSMLPEPLRRGFRHEPQQLRWAPKRAIPNVASP